eukprot:1191354-Prorocentrum_minimum.AAC.2
MACRRRNRLPHYGRLCVADDMVRRLRGDVAGLRVRDHHGGGRLWPRRAHPWPPACAQRLASRRPRHPTESGSRLEPASRSAAIIGNRANEGRASEKGCEQTAHTRARARAHTVR